MNPAPSSNLGSRHHDDHATAHLAERTIACTAAAMLGIFLLGLSAGGLVNPGYAGLHLNLTHNLILIVTGALSFYIGLAGTVAGASTVSLVFGLMYSLFALAGMAFGGPGDHTVAGISPGHGVDDQLIRIIPGYLEFGARDHLLHLGLGAVYLLSALLGMLGGERD
jgi:hypothetical protein